MMVLLPSGVTLAGFAMQPCILGSIPAGAAENGYGPGPPGRGMLHLSVVMVIDVVAVVAVVGALAPDSSCPCECSDGAAVHTKHYDRSRGYCCSWG